MDNKISKIALICSSGGHLFELICLENYWKSRDRFWVSFQTIDAQHILKSECVYWAYYPTNRSIKNFIRNLVLATKILKRECPDAIITTGAGVSVPFVLIGKLFRIKTVYIESIARSKNLSLSGYLIYPFVDNLLVQWPELSRRFNKAEYKGQII